MAASERTPAGLSVGRQASWTPVTGCGRPAQLLERADDDLGLALAGPVHLLLDPLAQLVGGVEAHHPVGAALHVRGDGELH